MVDLTQAHKASIELLETRHDALVEAVRNYVNGSVQPSIDELIAAIEDVTTDIDTKEKMLLGLASRQAKKPVPSLILDFKTRHYLQGTRRPEKGYGIHDLLTVERASPKWVYNSSGNLTEVPANQPAYQHDPVTGEPQGILIEESRTNLLTWSEDLTQGVWRKFGATVTPEGTAPNGATAYRIETEGTTSNRVEQTVNIPLDNSTYTLSVYIKGGELDSAGQLNIRLTGGSGLEIIPDAPVLENGWQRYSVSLTNDGTNDTAIIRITRTGAVRSAVYSLPQFEVGSSPSSYIPTEDASVTRAADNVSRELGEEFNPAEGTVFVDVSRLLESEGSGTFNSPIATIGRTGRTTPCLAMYFPSESFAQGRLRLIGYPLAGSSSVIVDGVHLRSDADRHKLAFTYNFSTGEFRLAANGGVWTGNYDMGPQASQLVDSLIIASGLRRIGDQSDTNATLGEVVCIPRALSESELIELTS